MKVAFVSQPWNKVVPPVESGSLAIWNYQVARRLSEFCDVAIYARSADTQKHAEDHEGVHYRYIPTPLDARLLRLLGLSSRLRRSTRPYFSGGLYYIEYILRVSQDLRRMKYDLVHIWNLSQFVPIVRALNPGIKIVLHMQCEWLSQLDRKLISRGCAGRIWSLGAANTSPRRSASVFRGMRVAAGRCTTASTSVAMPSKPKTTTDIPSEYCLSAGYRQRRDCTCCWRPFRG